VNWPAIGVSVLEASLCNGMGIEETVGSKMLLTGDSSRWRATKLKARESAADAPAGWLHKVVALPQTRSGFPRDARRLSQTGP
jgi:hypothetical protein